MDRRSRYRGTYGQLAGAYHGEVGIPPDWRAGLAMRAKIEDAADRMYDMAEARGTAG